MPRAMASVQPAAVGQMSENQGASGPLHSVAERPIPRPRKLKRNEPRISPRIMDFVVGSGGNTSSSAFAAPLAVASAIALLLSSTHAFPRELVTGSPPKNFSQGMLTGSS